MIDEAFRGGGVVRRQIGASYPPRRFKGGAGRQRRIIARSAFVDLSRRSSHTSVRDLVGRWLPDLNPGTVVITLDISPPVAAGFAFHVLFLSDDVNMDVRYARA